MTEPPVNPEETSNTTSLSLLERARARDPAARERMASLYGPLVDHWCRRAGLQEADVADVRQEVLLAVDRKIHAFRCDRPGDTFRGWLRTITRNKLHDHWRQAHGRERATGGSDPLQQLQQVPADQGASDSDADAEEVGLVYRQALDLLRTEFGERIWQAFWRVVIDCQRPADVAAELGMTVNAVYLAKGRVLARLREEFAGLEEM